MDNTTIFTCGHTMRWKPNAYQGELDTNVISDKKCPKCRPPRKYRYRNVHNR